MNRLTVGIFSVALCCMTFSAFPAGTVTAHMMEIRAGMLVTGSIVVAPDGSVQSYALDQEKKLPGVVVSLIGSSVPAWRFVPTIRDGQAVAAKAAMNLRVVAKEQKDGGYSLSITGATFPQLTDTQTAAFAKRKVPIYPESAIRDHVQGTVYVTLRINQQGAVVDGFAEQVDLNTSPNAVPSEFQLKRWRAILSKACLAAMRAWTFDGLKPADATKGDWYATAPVNFHLFESGNGRVDLYGKWDIYLPGPIEMSPWPDAEKILPTNLDAIPPGSLALAAAGLHLNTPLGGS